MRTSVSSCNPESGVAVIIVIAVLTALLVLAVPFLAMAGEENAASVAPLARARVHDAVEAIQTYARFRLTQGHAASEAERAGANGPRSTPDTDTPDEATVSLDVVDASGKPLRDRSGVPIMHPFDNRGLTADLLVRDEQAYPNLLSSPPFLIAGSLGRSTLTQDITDKDTEVQVEDGSGFPEKDGYLLIEGEVISYETREGGTFLQCQRGMEGGLRARRHRADAWVLDDRAREIAMLPYKSPRAKGGWREPSEPTYVKEIALLGRSALSAAEVDRLATDFCVASGRFSPNRFGRKVTVLSTVDPTADQGDGFRISVASVDGFLPGTVVRITDGVQVEYGMVAQSQGRGFGRIFLHDVPENTFEGNKTTIQALLRHPVNINSAPKDVLTRIIDGIQLGMQGRTRGTQGRIDGDATALAVNAIIDNRPILGLQHLRRVLGEAAEGAELLFSEIQATGIFRNAVDPMDQELGTATVPFCFQSFDYYTVESVAVLNDQSGRELARELVRERIHVAPLGVLNAVLDTQEHFESPYFRSRLGPFTATHPFPTARWTADTTQPYGRLSRMLYRFGRLGAMVEDRGRDDQEQDLTFAEGVFANRDEGDVRLQPARMEGTGFTQHFDGPAYFLPDPTVELRDIDPEGFLLTRRPYEFDPRARVGASGPSQSMGGRGGRRRGGGGGGSSGQSQPGQNEGALQGRTSLNPVRFDTWYRTGRGGGGRQVIFDYGQSTGEDGPVSLAIESDGSLVGRVPGRTIDSSLDSLEEVSEIRWRPEGGLGFWQPETWYHIGFAYRGTKPEDLCLFVDGMAKGRPRYKSLLTGEFSDQDTSFSIEDAEEWPDRGVAQVGTEVVAFERIGDNFDVVQFQGTNWGRGQRGTKVRSHASGTPVSLYGYSTLPRNVSRRSGTVIHRGGGVLQDGLGPFFAASFAGNHVINLEIPAGGGQTVTVRLEVFDPTRPDGNFLTLVTDSNGTVDFDCFPASGGYIVIVSSGPGLPGSPAGAIEFARYQNRQGARLFGITGVPSPPNPGLAELAGDLTSGFFLDRQVHPVRLIGTGSIPTSNSLAAVFPVSVRLSDVSGYPEPDTPQGGRNSGTSFLGVALPAWNTDPEFVQVGDPDLTNLETNRIEWIRYHHKDPAGDLLCDEARFVMGGALALRSGYVGPGRNLIGAHLILRQVVPMRQQCRTEPLSDGRHGSGGEAVPCIRTVSHSRREAINVPNYQGDPAAPVNGQAWSSAGWGDRVTIEGSGSNSGRKEAAVAWAGLDEPSQLTFNIGQQAVTWDVRRNYEGQGWIAFYESPMLEYRQRSLPGEGTTQSRERYVRILKFPSGELPDIAAGSRAVAGGTLYGEVASGDGYLDEIRVVPFAPFHYVVWDHNAMDLGSAAGATSTSTTGGGVSENSDEIPIANVEWMVSNPRQPDTSVPFYILPDGRKITYDEELRGLPNANAGLVWIDEEIIAFRGIGRGRDGGPALLDCQRGFMNTLPTRHGYGARVAFLDFLPVTMLQNGVDATTPRLDVASNAGFVFTGGTVLIDDEMIHYTSVDGQTLVMPWRLEENADTDGGMFRGRYGTAPAAHGTQSIVLPMPFRYWDRYVPRQDSGELSWYGFGLDVPGGFFHQLAFEKRRPSEYTDIEVLVRTDSRVPWFADPAATPGLFLFTDSSAQEPNLVNVAGDGFEVRVFFKYMSGAFDVTTMMANGWKSTPILESLRVSYLDQTRVLSREVSR